MQWEIDFQATATENTSEHVCPVANLSGFVVAFWETFGEDMTKSEPITDTVA